MGTKRPIALFDSGVGGLSVLKELIKELPNENYLYLADTARFPYGSKPPQSVAAFTRSIVNYLEGFNPKIIVIACNTATVARLRFNSAEDRVPVVGMVGAGSRLAVRATRSKRVGITGTETTVNSGVYEEMIGSIDPEIMVFKRSCPVLVTLIEAGEYRGRRVREEAERCLLPLLCQDIDTLVLACTHFPLAIDLLRELAGKEVSVVDPATEVANEVKAYLAENNFPGNPKGGISVVVTGNPSEFSRVGELYVGKGFFDSVDSVSLPMILAQGDEDRRRYGPQAMLD